MGSPVSIDVAEIVMQNIEECTLATCRQQYRSVYATLTTPLVPYTKTKLTTFTNTLRGVTLNYQFVSKAGF